MTASFLENKCGHPMLSTHDGKWFIKWVQPWVTAKRHNFYITFVLPINMQTVRKVEKVQMYLHNLDIASPQFFLISSKNKKSDETENTCAELKKEKIK